MKDGLLLGRPEQRRGLNRGGTDEALQFPLGGLLVHRSFPPEFLRFRLVSQTNCWCQNVTYLLRAVQMGHCGIKQQCGLRQSLPACERLF